MKEDDPMAAAAPVRLRRMPEESYADHFTSNDRKLLIEMAVKMERMGKDVEAIQGSGTSQYNSLRAEMVSVVTALEIRVRALENFRWWLLGAVAVVGPGLSALTSWLFSRLR